MISYIFLTAFLLSSGHGAPLPTTSAMSDVQSYLQHFGYLTEDRSGTPFVSATKLSEAIKEFQRFASLPVTGIFDTETETKMKLPRCGMSDNSGRQTAGSQRFLLQGGKWPVRKLTWSVTQFTKQLTQAEVEVQISKAWQLWSANTNLTFTKTTSGKADIEIQFVKGDHGDNFEFDGPGKILAHAFFPRNGGDAHFDDSETWTTGKNGVNLFIVAAHEFGHSLGLGHSMVKSALMAPFYEYKANLTLDQDDVAGIQAIYGASVKSLRESD